VIKLLRGLTIAIAAVTILAFVGFKLGGVAPGAAALTAALGSCSYHQIREASEIGPMSAKIQAGMHKVREDGKYQLWSTAQGDFWYLGAPSTQDAFVLAEEQFDIYQTTRIKPGAIVLDCGANYGTFTRRALLRGAAKVVAIEINPELADAMRRTFAKEIAEGRVVVYNKGVWDQDAELELRGDSVVLARDGPPVRVPVTTIDHIVAELHLPSVDFIKMDIEGAEKNALQGGKGTLARFAPTMALSTEHLPDDAQRIPALVSELVPTRYQVEWGYCNYDKPFHAAPNVIQFSK
jgi:FkbM family methyltransferase